MNYYQFGLFVIFFAAVLVVGLRVYLYLGLNDHLSKVKSLVLGEAWLLGSIVVVGELLALSILGLYRAPILWSVVLLQFLFLINRDVRVKLKELVGAVSKIDLPGITFLFFVTIFTFRNLYPLIDVDSHTTYLFTQKLWLWKGSSIWVDRGFDAQVFVPQFDAIAYGLGISLFGQETLFAQLINIFWRWIVLLLVFGYVRYRFNGWYAVASALFLILNDHFFISGSNQWVIINGAVIALLFGIGYNLWESKAQNNLSRLVLAIVFLPQLMANKYQMAYVLFFLMGLVLLIHGDRLKKIKSILLNKRWLVAIVVSGLLTSLWYLKNYLATGLATYPILAGKFHVLGWDPERQSAFLHVFRGLSPNEVLKYLSYLFIWPGINTAKYTVLILMFLPFIVMISMLRGKFEKEKLEEICYWLIVSVLVLVGICLASHQDPRYYRYVIGVYTFTAILGIDYVFRNCLGIKNYWMIGIVLIVLSFQGYSVVKEQGGAFIRPSVQDNLNVLTNKLYIKDIVARHYPQNNMAEKVLLENQDKKESIAWDIDSRPRLSAFLLPTYPQLGLWVTTIVAWSSYDDPIKVVKDLDAYGIKSIINVDHGDYQFLSNEEYAQKAVLFNRYPDTIAYPYDMPAELTRTKF